MRISNNIPQTTIVIGGGIGGLSTAVALQQLGREVNVFEKATELKELGAGIVLAAKCYKDIGKARRSRRSS